MRERIQSERIALLNARNEQRGRYVVYWMQASQRASCNHALEFAIDRANELRQPLVAYVGVTPAYPEANLRHYRFMFEGLSGVRRDLAERRIRLVVRAEPPERGIVALARQASLVVVDRAYTRVPRGWRFAAATRLACPLVQVETNVVVPVEEASPKEEYSAATIRPKIRRALDRYLVPLAERSPRVGSLDLDLPSLDLADIDAVLATLRIDRSVPPAEAYRGGAREAERRLRAFLRDGLDRYAVARNDPNEACVSGLSPYLHFGQISPLAVALAVRTAGGPGAEAFLEELVVRRELAMNFAYYNERYDSIDCLPRWARDTLRAHAHDPRAYRYSQEDFENARTHDPYWNAAQEEMRRTGKMHGYMRMYWGKKILEWSASPAEAYATALRLNNRWELDGRDPNGFAGVAWCFGKHDRPWRSRLVFGTVRFMNAAGLRRKFDADAYARAFAPERS